MKLLFGDIHNHCGITYGFGSLENALQNAKSTLDFCAITGHAMWPDMPKLTPDTEFLINFHKKGFEKLKNNFDEIKKTIKAANTTDKFTALYGYEMHSSYYGDYHIVSYSDQLPLVYANSPKDLMEKIAQFTSLDNKETTIIPHHIAYSPNYRGINWDEFNQDISPVVEVCSKHGVSINDTSYAPYYHNMGARDGRNTVYEGIRKQKIFGFVGSTDHHGGFPGSYGDCKVAVLCEKNTPESIMEAIKARRTYAVTADNIRVEFKVDGHNFGEVYSEKLTPTTRKIELNVEASNFIDKVIVFKDLKPIYILNGEELTEINETGTYKVRVEMGWGNTVDLYDFIGEVSVKNGKILNIEKCFRGKSVLAPSKEMTDDDNLNKFQTSVEFNDTSCDFKLQTAKNVSTLHASTAALIFEIQGDLNTTLNAKINGKELSYSINELICHSFTTPIKETNSQTIKFHLAVPQSQYRFSKLIQDIAEQENHSNSKQSTNINLHIPNKSQLISSSTNLIGTIYTCYHAEITQKNGSSAFISPVFILK